MSGKHGSVDAAVIGSECTLLVTVRGSRSSKSRQDVLKPDGDFKTCDCDLCRKFENRMRKNFNKYFASVNSNMWVSNVQRIQSHVNRVDLTPPSELSCYCSMESYPQASMFAALPSGWTYYRPRCNGCELYQSSPWQTWVLAVMLIIVTYFMI